MDAQDAGPTLEREHARRERARQALVGLGGARGEAREKALARGTYHDRPPDAHELIQAREQLQVVRDRLAEADARVEQHLLLAHALAHREGEPLLQKRLDLAHHVLVARVALHRARIAEHVHEAALGAAGGHHPDHARVAAQGGDVVHEDRPRLERRRGHRGLGGVDRDHGAAVAALDRQRRYHGPHARDLLLRGDLLCARARGFAAHVDDVGAFGEQRAAVLDRRPRL